MSVRSADLSIACVSGRTMQALNRKYRKHDYATDVLAFDLCDSRSSNARYLTGEIIISVDAARQNVRLYNTTLRQELTLYLIHGILHLVGYDDRNPPAAARMHRRQQQVLTRIER